MKDRLIMTAAMLGLTTTPSLSQQNDLFGALAAGNVPILDWQAYGATIEITEPPVWLTPETQMGMAATAKTETNAWTTQAARLAASKEAIIIGDYTILKDPEGNLIAAQEDPEAPDTIRSSISAGSYLGRAGDVHSIRTRSRRLARHQGM